MMERREEWEERRKAVPDRDYVSDCANSNRPVNTYECLIPSHTSVQMGKKYPDTINRFNDSKALELYTLCWSLAVAHLFK